MFKWIVALLLMLLYQYWVYSLFWTDANAVSEVENIQHYSGSISRIGCVTITKMYGATNDRVNIELKQGQTLSFLDRGKGRKNCNDFYQQLEKILPVLESNGVQQPVLESNGVQQPFKTEIRGQMYPELKFEGYFRGANPLYISIEGHEWISFQEQKNSRQGFALFLSLTPIFSILFVWFIRFVKKL